MTLVVGRVPVFLAPGSQPCLELETVPPVNFGLLA